MMFYIVVLYPFVIVWCYLWFLEAFTNAYGYIFQNGNRFIAYSYEKLLEFIINSSEKIV